LLLGRSAVVSVLGFVVVLVALRLLTRRTWLAFALASLLFVPMAMPRGELVGLNLALAMGSTAILLVVFIRVGLLAAMLGTFINSALQAGLLTWHLTVWPGNTSWVVLAIVLGLGGAGFWRALAGKARVLQAVE
jgi:hypothetical protein